MSTLTEHMKAIVANNSVGFVATVDEDGTPNLSPKGTCLALDAETIVFGEIRSPRTLGNLQARPSMEINFIDFFSRKAVRAKGRAQFLPRGSAEFEALIGHFARWGELVERINGIVRLHVERARLVISPAYDLGATEAELRESWRKHFLNVSAG